MIVSSNRYGERKDQSTKELITGRMQSQEETEAEEGKRNENKFMGNRNNNVQQCKSNKKDYLETRGNKELEL